MYSTTDFRKGLKIEVEGTPYEIIEFQHFKPGKGGAMVQGVKQTYQLIEESFDAYLDSLTIEMLLESVKNGDNRRLFLAERLEDEGKRLAENA